MSLLDHFMDLNHAWRFGPAACELVQVRLLDAQGAAIADTFHFPLGLAPLAAAPQRDLGLQVHVAADGDAAHLRVTTRGWAIGVHLDVPGWTSDDNHFHLAPGSTQHVRLHRARDGAPLAGSLHALNLSGSLPSETTP